MNLQRNTVIRLSVYLALAFGNSCNDTLPTETLGPTTLVFSRDSEWRLDSLDEYEPFQYVSAIWASSTSDIYTVGSSVLHFNGLAWTLVPMHSSVGGPISTSFGFSDVFGFSSLEVYVVGTKLVSSTHWPLVVHYDGLEWKVASLPLTVPSSLTVVWGSSPRSVWVGGDKGIIFHFNGTSWTQEQILFQPSSGDSWLISDIAGCEGSEPFALIFLTNSTMPYEMMYLIVRAGEHWELVDSLSTTANRCRKLYMSPSKTLYSAGRNLGRWNGTQWEVLKQGSDPRSVFQLAANNDDNFFIVGGSVYGGSGFVEHYDGSTWATFATSLSSTISFSDATTDGAAIAALGWDQNFSCYVLRSQPR